MTDKKDDGLTYDQISEITDILINNPTPDDMTLDVDISEIIAFTRAETINEIIGILKSDRAVKMIMDSIASNIHGHLFYTPETPEQQLRNSAKASIAALIKEIE